MPLVQFIRSGMPWCVCNFCLDGSMRVVRPGDTAKNPHRPGGVRPKIGANWAGSGQLWAGDSKARRVNIGRLGRGRDQSGFGQVRVNAAGLESLMPEAMGVLDVALVGGDHRTPPLRRPVYESTCNRNQLRAVEPSSVAHHAWVRKAGCAMPAIELLRRGMSRVCNLSSVRAFKSRRARPNNVRSFKSHTAR